MKGRIAKAIDTKMLNLGVFLDTEQAFEKVTFNSFGMALQRHGVNVILRQWIKQFMCNKSAYVSQKTLPYQGTLCELKQRLLTYPNDGVQSTS